MYLNVMSLHGAKISSSSPTVACMHTHRQVSHKLTQSQMSGACFKIRFYLKMDLSRCRSRCLSKERSYFRCKSLWPTYSFCWKFGFGLSFSKTSYKPSDQKIPYLCVPVNCRANVPILENPKIIHNCWTALTYFTKNFTEVQSHAWYLHITTQ